MIDTGDRIAVDRERAASFTRQMDARFGHLPVFGIISWGCAATTWVARALNLHPDISCMDGLRAKVTGSFGMAGWDAVDYLRLVRAHAEGYPLAGDIHSLHYADTPLLREHFGDLIRLCSIVRDPLPRVGSFLGLARQLGYDRGWCDPSYLRDLPQASAILPLLAEAPERPYFAHAVLACNGIMQEHAIGPVLRMEDLTTDPAAFARLVAYISGDRLAVDADLSERIGRLGPVNPHAGYVHRLSPASWQRTVFDALLDPEARRLYRELGYDV